ncbi:hypothetical protein FIBSPDRAFT_554762 [Athelia psychrophila]|uniref:Uncharacterized protein n=1 Tax=Athelia psychrophila TaxID=1759441 RepID=A0A166IGA7_9AGAM|nr:hypothetical protein FIBSPDRAFT_554762 [Fibularhizoctonia sp. CBS 109695]
MAKALTMLQCSIPRGIALFVRGSLILLRDIVQIPRNCQSNGNVCSACACARGLGIRMAVEPRRQRFHVWVRTCVNLASVRSRRLEHARANRSAHMRGSMREGTFKGDPRLFRHVGWFREPGGLLVILIAHREFQYAACLSALVLASPYRLRRCRNVYA